MQFKLIGSISLTQNCNSAKCLPHSSTCVSVYRNSKNHFHALISDYPDYNTNFGAYGANVKYEDGEEQKYRPQEHEKLHENNGQGYSSHANEEGEYDDRDY